MGKTEIVSQGEEENIFSTIPTDTQPSLSLPPHLIPLSKRGLIPDHAQTLKS